MLATAPRRFTLRGTVGAVSSSRALEVAGGPSLGPVQYRLDVPVGVDRALRIELTADRDVDLLLRRGSPVALGTEGQLVADAARRGPGASKTLVALLSRTPNTVRTDIYASYPTTGLPLSLSIEPGDPPFEGFVGGAQRSCVLDIDQFVVEVPAIATALEIHLESELLVPLIVLSRFGERIVVDQGRAIFDEQMNGEEGPIIIRGQELRAGRYFFAVANCQRFGQSYDFYARMRTPNDTVERLSANLTTEGTVAPVSADSDETLHHAQYVFNVPDGVGEVIISAWGGPCADEDIDVLVTAGQPVHRNADGEWNAGWRSTHRGPGAETLVLGPESSPPFEGNRYFVGILNREVEPVQFSVGYTTRQLPSVPLALGESVSDVIAGTFNRDGVLGEQAYRVEVASSVEAFVSELLAVDDPELDVDLLGRFALPVDLPSARCLRRGDDPACHLRKWSGARLRRRLRRERRWCDRRVGRDHRGGGDIQARRAPTSGRRHVWPRHERR